MDRQRQRELRGVRLIVMISLFIAGLGVVMMLLEQSASGPFGTRLSRTRDTSISGFQTIVLGILMLIGIGIIYLVDIKRKAKRRK